MEMKIRPMLAYPAEPFDSDDFLFEWKFDGTRCICFVGEKLRLQNRRLMNITYRYPELQLQSYVNAKKAILDGEIVVLREGKPSFRDLQLREHVVDPLRIELLSRSLPATFIAFDILYLDGQPLVELPLIERKENLKRVVKESPRLILSRHVEGEGKRFFGEVVKLGLEGVMAKRKDSAYQIGRRSRDWLKIKSFKSIDCVIVGFTPGEGWREPYFGALLLGAYHGGRLRFLGKVGTGFDEALLRCLAPLLRKLLTEANPVGEEPPYPARWVKPELVCEVKFLELTDDMKLRAPAFRRLREDKAPDECKLEGVV
jgi:bifunctional non-homologous end joining protein LigD